MEETGGHITTESADRSASQPTTTDSTLRSFLGSGSVACPSCRYDLKGCEETRCPECGWGLTLQLRPRVSFVPYWLFAVMIYGWLMVWGSGGSLTTIERAWEYHSIVSRRWARQASAAQTDAMIRQFLARSDSAVLAGSTSDAPGALVAPVIPPPSSALEDLRTYFVAQSTSDQITMLIFFASACVGVVGLMVAPFMRRLSPRFNSWLIALGVGLFSAMVVNYTWQYVNIRMRNF